LKEYHGGKDAVTGKAFLLQDGIEVAAGTALVLDLE
jgi:hypothetical protein